MRVLTAVALSLLLQFSSASGSFPLTSGPVWVRMGTILTNSAQEPNVIYENSCSLIAGPCFRMWFTDIVPAMGTYICYAEASTDLQTVQKASCPGAFGGGNESFIFKNGSTYYGYYNVGTNSISRRTSSDGLTWSSPVNSVLTKGTAGAWDDSGVFNSSVYVDGSVWRMIYEATGTGTDHYQCGEATSVDTGLTWVKSVANPVSSSHEECSGPWLTKINGQLWNWGHGGTGPLPSNLYRWFVTWDAPLVRVPTGMIFQGATSDEGFGRGNGQVADPFLVEVSGSPTYTYIFYTASPDGNSVFTIKAARAPLTIAQLAATGEGMTSNAP